jgi:predicted DNA-binding transcriptional regulator YafY
LVLGPLHLDYWGRIWTCVAWDETAASFREIRMDRINDLSPLPGLFVEEPGKGLADYRAQKQKGRPQNSRPLVTE